MLLDPASDLEYVKSRPADYDYCFGGFAETVEGHDYSSWLRVGLYYDEYYGGSDCCFHCQVGMLRDSMKYALRDDTVLRQTARMPDTNHSAISYSSPTNLYHARPRAYSVYGCQYSSI